MRPQPFLDSISVHLLDYNILGFIILSDFTNKWKIRGNKKIAQIRNSIDKIVKFINSMIMIIIDKNLYILKIYILICG